ncbi:MAG: vWA domain-containing protein [Acidimicrobiales bacterium]
MLEVAGYEPFEATRLLVNFGIALRNRGLSVPVSSVCDYVDAVATLGFTTTDAVYWAGRTTLVTRPEDIAVYDKAFVAFWGDRDMGPEPVVTIPVVRDPSDPQESSGPEGLEGKAVRYSSLERLADKDFALCTSAELAQALEAMRSLRVRVDSRRSRRWAKRRPGERPDLRSSFRRSMRLGGELVVIDEVGRLARLRRLVVLCDVSGSMEPYTRALLRFAHILVAGRRRVEAFAIGTRLTRLTRELSSRDPDAALAAAACAVVDWAGGTRLGEGIRAFNNAFGIAGVARAAQVVICSDGWDTGDPGLLAAEMARLHNVAHQVVWVNPLKGTLDYEPLAQGMAAALPHVDRFLEGHNLTSLRALLEVIA